jgi:hypothetical protein
MAPTMIIRPGPAQQAEIGLNVVSDRNGVEYEVELRTCGLHRLLVGRDEDVMRTKALGFGGLAFTGGDGGDFSAERCGELYAEVAEPADPRHGDLL